MTPDFQRAHDRLRAQVRWAPTDGEDRTCILPESEARALLFALGAFRFHGDNLRRTCEMMMPELVREESQVEDERILTANMRKVFAMRAHDATRAYAEFIGGNGI